jgi:hypothetical protein
VPTDGSQRIEYFQNLDRHLVTRRRLIIGGDFNCMLDLGKDKRGGNESGADWQVGLTGQTPGGPLACKAILGPFKLA